MTDCTNLEMRDVLPDLARGALTGPSLVAAEGHLATCATCRAELALVRQAQALLGVTPSVDTSRIVAAIGRSSAMRRDATIAVAETRRRRAWNVAAPRRRAWLAAASIVAVAGAALLALNVTRGPDSRSPSPVVAIDAPGASTPTSSEPAEPVRATTPPPARVEIVMGGGVSDLADADLESLLHALEGVDTELDVEPAVLLPVLEGDV